MGTKKVRSETPVFCLALGLPPNDRFNRLLSLRTLLKDKRVVVLLPSHPITDQSQLCHLAAEQIYPLALSDAFEDDSLKLRPDKLEKLLRLQREIGKNVILVIDTRKQLVLYKNQPATLRPKAFKLLLVLARQAGEVVLRNDIYTFVWGDIITLSYLRQIDDHKRNIQDALLKLCNRKNGITKKEIGKLITTRKKLGFQLNLKPDQVEII